MTKCNGLDVTLGFLTVKTVSMTLRFDLQRFHNLLIKGYHKILQIKNMTKRNKIEYVKCLWHRRKVSSTYKLFNYYLLNVKMLFLAVNEFAGSVTVEIR